MVLVYRQLRHCRASSALVDCPGLLHCISASLSALAAEDSQSDVLGKRCTAPDVEIYRTQADGTCLVLPCGRQFLRALFYMLCNFSRGWGLGFPSFLEGPLVSRDSRVSPELSVGSAAKILLLVQFVVLGYKAAERQAYV